AAPYGSQLSLRSLKHDLRGDHVRVRGGAGEQRPLHVDLLSRGEAAGVAGAALAVALAAVATVSAAVALERRARHVNGPERARALPVDLSREGRAGHGVSRTFELDPLAHGAAADRAGLGAVVVAARAVHLQIDHHHHRGLDLYGQLDLDVAAH